MQFNRQRYRRFRSAKRIVFALTVWIILQAPASWAGTIVLQVTSLGSNIFRYQFSPSGFDLLKNQELDIRFDPLQFQGLFNGVADSDFRLTLLQPNNPIGAFGDYSTLALTDDPPFQGPFRVDAIALSANPPQNLPYVVRQFDSTGQLITGSLGGGVAAAVGAPEPAGLILAGAGLAIVFIVKTKRRHK